jgi:DNA-binding MarR family transcriptional regulator
LDGHRAAGPLIRRTHGIATLARATRDPWTPVNDVDILLNQLCHLMVAFERAIGAAPDRSSDELDLDMPELAVLVSLDLFGGMRPTTVAQLLGGTTSMANKVLGRLERAGLLVRHLGVDPQDRRAVTVEIADRGRRAIETCERILAELSIDLLAAMAAVEFRATSPGQHGQHEQREQQVPGDRPPSTGPGLAEFLRFVVEIDKPILSTVGSLEPLHPADPRGLLLLSELDLRGPLRVGAVPAVIDRSRNAAHRLCTNLEAAGFVTRVQGAVPGDGRGVVVELTDLGRAILRGVVAAITAHLGELRPCMISLSLALSGERQGLGAPTA